MERKIETGQSFDISWGCDECDEIHQYNLLTGVASVKVEYRLPNCQPDIALLTADNMVKAVIEVVVKHKPEDYAVKYYKDNEIILIQIDLQSFDDIDHWKSGSSIRQKLHSVCLPFVRYAANARIRRVCGSSIPIVGNAEIR